MQQNPNQKQNNGFRDIDDVEREIALQKVKRTVWRQGALAGFIVLLILVLVFAMTVAWYTNVAQTNGLMFDAAVWGFEGELNFPNEGMSIEAAPGDEGVIEISATSTSTETTSLSVTVSKSAMIPEMQKRIYFYVDSPVIRNGEVMERYYLSNTESYTYTIFENGTLNLTERYHNDALLKWHWVYDVLGYYVQGTFDDDEMVITEYVRPIEYDYDEATTTFEKDADGQLNGELLTVDGVTTPEEFLVKFSETDGYKGVIDPREYSYGYYPVDVDPETGYGVWAYLCDYSEIKGNTVFDTALGNGDLDNTEYAGPYPATVVITSQVETIEPFDVYTADGLRSALAMQLEEQGEAVLRLADNVTLNETLTVGAGENVVLDLGENELDLTMGGYNANALGGIHVAEGGALTVMNGTVKGTVVDQGHVFTTRGGSLTLNNVTITDVETAVYVRDDKAVSDADSVIRIVNSTINTKEECIYLSGNGTVTGQRTRLIIDNSALTSGFAGIYGNGNDFQGGTDIQVTNSEINGYYTGIYNPQRDSILTVSEGSTIQGLTGLVIKGGTVRLKDSTFYGNSTNPVTPDGYPGSGFTDSGDGIYIEANYVGEIVVEIEGNTVAKSDRACGFRVYKENAPNVSVKIYSGQFLGAEASEVERWMAEDSSYEENTDGQYIWAPAGGDDDEELDEETMEESLLNPDEEEETPEDNDSVVFSDRVTSGGAILEI